MEDHHRPMIDGQPPEAPLELVAIDDGAQPIRSRRLVSRQETEVGCPAAGPAPFRVASADQEPVRPGVKTRRVAELRKVPPDREQRLLRRVLGKVDVTQDPVRHGMEAVAGSDGEAREGLPVTPLRPFHQICVHLLPPVGTGFRPARSHGMGTMDSRATQSSYDGANRVALTRLVQPAAIAPPEGSASGSDISNVSRIGSSGRKTTTITATTAAAIPTQKLEAIATESES